MFIDSHAHLASPQFANNIEEIISNARQNKVEKIITIGCTIAEAKASIKIAEKYAEVYATAGIYPNDTKNDTEANWPLDKKIEEIEQLASHEKVVAIGECGLDFSETHSAEINRGPTEQFERFEKQIALAEKLNKPFIIHSREATADTLRILKSYGKPLNAVWHCFSESLETAEEALKLGLMLSFTGNITYKKNTELKDLVRQIPIDKIMIETDSPYLTPHKARSVKVKVNEPQYVRMIAEEIALIKGISIEEVAERTTQNTSKFYSLPS